VELLPRLSSRDSALWVKRDDQTSLRYGGNKVRKLERLLSEAKRRGVARIVTIGAVGSHHVLATGVYARPLGIEVEAVLVPQPRTPHVVMNLRADLAQGVKVLPATSFAHAGVRVASRLGRDAYFIPVGGSNRLGALGYVDAARELAAQVRAGQMPEPDLVVVTLGSGGTAAGLAAGLLEEMQTVVLGVTVSDPAWVVEHMGRSLAHACLKHATHREGRAAKVEPRLEWDRRYLGRGYGQATPEGERAMAVAAESGLTLDPTYTAKTFAAALDRVAAGKHKTILYWHTLSSAPFEPLLIDAPEEAAIGPELAKLFR